MTLRARDARRELAQQWQIKGAGYTQHAGVSLSHPSEEAL